MPELPEVETIKRGLASFLLNQKFTNIEILCEKSFIGPKNLAINSQIVSLERRGKALLINLKNGITLMVHLRMTGQLIFRKNGTSAFAGGHPSDSFFTELPNKQTRVVLSTQNGTLFFNDQRKFGFIKVLETTEVENEPFIKNLAKEPWEMSLSEFKANLFRHKNSCIKGTILDQKVIAGVGNIYADEALFDAKIHPARLTGSLSEKEVKNLLSAIKKVMDASINSGGSTMATYVKADGTRGDYLRLFAQVFRRENEPCKRCGTEIKKIRVAGRGTHICPKCQKIKN